MSKKSKPTPATAKTRKIQGATSNDLVEKRGDDRDGFMMKEFAIHSEETEIYNQIIVQIDYSFVATLSHGRYCRCTQCY